MFMSLVSGSSGNASIVKSEKTTLLVDCGLSGKRLMNLLEKEGMSCKDIDAMLITHEHTDHITGAGVISRRFDIPIYASAETHLNMNIGNISDKNIKTVEKNSDFTIGDIDIHSFPICHDAKNPLGYTFLCEGEKYCIATDTGHITEEMFSEISGGDYVMLEANHDVDMLMYGEYPYSLKKRILGDYGHLSNDAAAQWAMKLIESNTRHIMLSHLSDKNNTAAVAYKTVENALVKQGVKLGSDIGLCVANRYEVTRFI